MIAIGIAWLGYFALHSILASLTVKRWTAARFPNFMPAYRICFNALASIALLPVLWLLYNQPGPAVWAWSGAWTYMANCLALSAIGGFIYTLRDYDGNEFLGISQLRKQTRTVEDQECFHIGGIHRFVRHPWYFLALVTLWTRNMSEGMLTTAVVMTLYFIVGSKLEERKLIAYHGERYVKYMEKVCGLLPLPWKTISKSEARQLAGGDRIVN